MAILGEETLIEKFASVEPQTIDAVTILRGVRAVQAILFVVAPEGEITILVGIGVIRVLAILGLLVDDGEAGDGIEETTQLFQERNAVTVGLSEFQGVPSIAEETVVTVDGEGDVRGIHGDDFAFAETAGALRETSLVSVRATQERAAVWAALRGQELQFLIEGVVTRRDLECLATILAGVSHWRSVYLLQVTLFAHSTSSG